MKIFVKTFLLTIFIALALTNFTSAALARDYGDNVLDIRDYNIFVSCFGSRLNTSTCLNKEAADLNDDGVVDSSDFTLLFASFQTQYGD